VFLILIVIVVVVISVPFQVRSESETKLAAIKQQLSVNADGTTTGQERILADDITSARLQSAGVVSKVQAARRQGRRAAAALHPRTGASCSAPRWPRTCS